MRRSSRNSFKEMRRLAATQRPRPRRDRRFATATAQQDTLEAHKCGSLAKCGNNTLALSMCTENFNAYRSEMCVLGFENTDCRLAIAQPAGRKTLMLLSEGFDLISYKVSLV